MTKNIWVKKENRIRKSGKIAETRMAVYIYIYIVYCHLENKKGNLQNVKYICKVYNYKFEFKKLNIKNKDRTILNLYRNQNIKNILKNFYILSV